MKEDRFSPKRMIRMLGILISVAIYSVFLAIICKFTIDRVLVLVFINALYLPLLIAVIEMERIRGHLNRNEKRNPHNRLLLQENKETADENHFFHSGSDAL